MSPKNNPAAVSLGRKGGQARAKNLTPEQRSESARQASEARWAKTLRDLDEKNATLARTKAPKQKKEAGKP